MMAAAAHGLSGRVRMLLAGGRARTAAARDIRSTRDARPCRRRRSLATGGRLAAARGGRELGARPVDALLAAVTAGDRDEVRRLLADEPGVRERALERRPDQLVRAVEQSRPAAVALLIELGFDVNTRPRTAPLHEAAMRGDLDTIRLLLAHGADPTLRNTAYDATPAGWAEHHGQPRRSGCSRRWSGPAPPGRGRSRPLPRRRGAPRRRPEPRCER